MVTGAMTVRATAAHPVPSLLAYVADADSGAAWLAAPASTARAGSWTASVLGAQMHVGEPGTKHDTSTMPAWLPDALPWSNRLAGRTVPRVPLAGPVVTVLHDSVTAAGRALTVHVQSPSGVLGTEVRVPGMRVRAAQVDGRRIETTRFRRAQHDWEFTFSAPPDSGFTLAFTLAPDAGTEMQVTSIAAGLPVMPGVTVPPRSAGHGGRPDRRHHRDSAACRLLSVVRPAACLIAQQRLPGPANRRTITR